MFLSRAYQLAGVKQEGRDYLNQLQSSNMQPNCTSSTWKGGRGHYYLPADSNIPGCQQKAPLPPNLFPPLFARAACRKWEKVHCRSSRGSSGHAGMHSRFAHIAKAALKQHKRQHVACAQHLVFLLLRCWSSFVNIKTVFLDLAGQYIT